MRSYCRLAAVALAALLGVAGCWNPSPEKYPSITFFGADYGTITSGTDGSGNTVQGAVTLTWQTRLADKVNLVATTVSTGKTTIIKTFAAGDTTSCTVNPQFANSDCVKDGTYQVSPTEDTVYNIQAVVGAGNCARDKVLGNLLHPDQCNDLTADPNASLTVIPITVVPPSTITLGVNGSGTTTVAPGTDVMADYAVTGASAFDFGIAGTDANGNPSYTQCGAAGDSTTPCNMPPVDANGNVPTSGQITVPNVTANTVLTGESTNGADDGLGDVAANTTGATLNIVVPGTPSITTFTATPDHVNPSASGVTVALAWTVASADTVAVTMDSSSTGAATGMSGCTGVDNTGAGTCNVSVTGTDGQQVVLNMVASNSVTSQTSGTQAVTVMIGAKPAPTLTASPTDITSGSSVDLTWTAATATSVVITDGNGGTVVDTTANPPTSCNSGNACAVTGDTITVSNVTATTTWTITATSAFGTGTATATATVHTNGAAITGVTVDSNDALTGTPVMVTADTATLAWTATDAMGGSLSADVASDAPSGNCSQVATANWTQVTGFTFGSGTYGLTGVNQDMCYELKATGYGALGNDTKYFMVQRQLKITTVSVNGTDVTASNTANVAPGTASAKIDLTSSYATAKWAMYTVAKTPAQACANATFPAVAAASGTMTTGTASYTISPFASATCVQITVTHPTDTSRTQTYILTITNN